MLIRPSHAAAPKAVYRPHQEPPQLRGALFQQERDGTLKVLRYSGETSPNSPPDVGDDAALGGEVFISVNGIDQDWAGHRQQITDWYHGGFSTGADWQRPIIGIHEGDRDGAADILRIMKNTLLLKALQTGIPSVEAVRKAAYANDPSVKTIYDQLRQTMAAGRQATLMAHSGGGSQVALALTLLTQENDGALQEAVRDDVRVMATAATATRDDLLLAGLKDENIFMTYSKRDPVPAFYRTPTSMLKPLSILRGGVRGLTNLIRDKIDPGPWHEGHYIFAQNMTPQGSRIVDFLEGGEGGTSPLR